MKGGIASVLGMTCAVFLLVSGAQAATMAPGGYPAPGGTSFSNSPNTPGAAGLAGGQTRTYNLTDSSQFDQLWWGVVGPAMGNNCCFALSSLTAIGAFGGASQTWTGNVTIQFNNGSPFSVSTLGRLTSTVISGASNWLDPSTQGIGGAGSPLAVIEVTDPSTFVVNNKFEILIGGNWLAFLPWYNSMDGNVYGSRIHGLSRYP